MRKKRNGNPTAAIIGGIFLLVAAIFVSVVALKGPAELKKVSEIKASEMSTDYSYYFDELIIYDHYMTQSGGDSGNGKYYLVAFYGEDDRLYVASLYAEKDEDMKTKLWDYAKDPETQFGDLIVSGCFKTRKVTSIDKDEEFYSPSFATFKKLILENWGQTAVDTQLHLDFVCEDAADYESEASQMPLLIVAGIFVLLGGVLLYFGLKAKKKQKAEEEARARFNANQPEEQAPYQGPEF